MTAGGTAHAPSAGNTGPRSDVLPVDDPVRPTMRGAVTHTDTDAGAIEVSPEGDGTLVTLRGEIDGSLRDQAGLSMAQVVSRGGPVAVDLADLTFIDSSGLAFLIQLHGLSREEPRQHLVLRNPPTLVLDLLEMVGLGGEIALDFTPGDAEPAESAPAPTPAAT